MVITLESQQDIGSLIVNQHSVILFKKISKQNVYGIAKVLEKQGFVDARTFEIMFGEVVCKKKDEMGYGKLMAFDLDFYNKHHLDWRGLIPKGLAEDATCKNIY